MHSADCLVFELLLPVASLECCFHRFLVQGVNRVSWRGNLPSSFQVPFFAIMLTKTEKNELKMTPLLVLIVQCSTVFHSYPYHGIV